MVKAATGILILISLLSTQVQRLEASSACEVHFQDLPKLIAKVKTKDSEVLSRNFEGFELVDIGNQYEYIESWMNTFYREGYYDGTDLYSIPCSNGFPDDGYIFDLSNNEKLIVMRIHSLGENSMCIFTVWKSEGNNLSLKEILNLNVQTGYGSISISEVIIISEDEYILVVRDEGGDGGEYWGSISVLHYRQPISAQNICTEKYYGNGFIEEEFLDYVFDKAVNQIEFIRKNRKIITSTDRGDSEDTYSEWVVTTKIVDLNPFLKR